jgi:hypothetical protein
MASDSTSPDVSQPPSLILRRLLDLSCFYARTAADERDNAQSERQQLQQQLQGMCSDKAALVQVRKQLETSEAQVQQLQATIADVTNTSALESRVLLQKIAQLSEGTEHSRGHEQQLQVGHPCQQPSTASFHLELAGAALGE